MKKKKLTTTLKVKKSLLFFFYLWPHAFFKPMFDGYIDFYEYLSFELWLPEM